MSAILSSIIRPAVTKGAGELYGLLPSYCDVIGSYFFRRRAVARLRELDDCALRDIGLDRTLIEAAVYGFVAPPDQGRM
jgi:uncharacterized protein YjiS (DUF1127 family)